MEANSPWFDNIFNEITATKAKLAKSDIRKYHVNALIRVARKVDKFAPACRTCQRYQGDIKKMIGYLKELPGIRADDEKDYFKKGNVIGEHLQAQHKLAMEGKYFGIGAVVGAAIGGLAGWASGFLYIALPICFGLGCLFGWLFESKARKDGKTL